MPVLPLPPVGATAEEVRRFLLSLEQDLGGAVAPNDAQFLVSTTNASLTNERNLGVLASGYLKITVGAGIAVPSTTTTIPGSDIVGAITTTALTVSNLTATRIPIVGVGGLLGDDADLTFVTDTLTATKLVGTTSVTTAALTNSGLTATRVTFAGVGGLLSDDADLTFVTDTLTATKVVAPTHVISPLHYGSTAANGDLTLEGTSSVTKTTSYVILQPTTGFVGVNTTTPGLEFDVNGSVRIRDTTGSSATGLYVWNGTANLLNYQGWDYAAGSVSYAFFGTNRTFISTGTTWSGSGFNFTRPGATIQVENDAFVFYQFAASSNTPVERFKISSGGFVGIGVTPAAVLHLKAGTTAAGTAPLGFTSGPLLTAAVALRVEALTDDLYFTITTGAARKKFVLDNGVDLVSGRVPFATTNGRLSDDADLTFATDTLTATKIVAPTSIGIGEPSPDGSLHITKATDASPHIVLEQTDGTGRSYEILGDSVGTWRFSDRTAGSAIRLSIDANANIGFNTVTFGTTMAKGIAVANGTAPTANVTDQFAMYAFDQAAGNSAPHFRTENGDIIKLFKTGTYTPTNVSVDRSFDANATTTDELADVLGTLIADLQLTGVLG